MTQEKYSIDLLSLFLFSTIVLNGINNPIISFPPSSPPVCLEKVLHLSGRVTRPVGKPQDHWAGALFAPSLPTIGFESIGAFILVTAYA
jgi:hypothetical protein